MPSAHLLLVDDDALLRRSLAFNLERAGYRVDAAGAAEDGLAMAQRTAPDLVLLDIGLPGMDGVEALRQFQQRLGVPVIFLTARRRELDQVLGLELGADDYVTKPFDLDVLVARVKAVLRRSRRSPARRPLPKAPLVVGDLVIDAGAHTVTIGGRSVRPAQPRVRAAACPGAWPPAGWSRWTICCGRVWGAEYEGEPQVVYVHVRWLREKLEDDPRHPRRLVTVRGVGYKLLPAATCQPAAATRGQPRPLRQSGPPED